MRPAVLHLIYDDPGNPWVAGGGSVRVRELYRRLTDRLDATVASGSYPGARDETVEGVRYLRLGARSPYAWSRLSYALAARALLARTLYDVAVFDFSTYTPILMPRGRPAAITVHHVTGSGAARRWGWPLGAGLARLERTMIRRAHCLSATSGATERVLREIAGPEVPIERVAAGVPDDLFALPRRPAGYLLSFGRLDVLQKGLDTLLDAFALLARERPGLELRIAGRGRDRERVLAMVRALSLEGRVRILGAVSEEERRELLSGALLQVMPSRFEGFGMAAAEAMAAGVPVVAAASGSLPEVVDPPRGGHVVPPDDPAALAAAVGELLDDPARLDEVSRSARGSAERFRWAAVAEAHLRFLHRTVSAAGDR